MDKLWPALLVALRTLGGGANVPTTTCVRYRNDLHSALLRNIVQLTLLTYPSDISRATSATTAIALASTFLCGAFESVPAAVANEQVKRRTCAAASGLFDSLLAYL